MPNDWNFPSFQLQRLRKYICIVWNGSRSKWLNSSWFYVCLKTNKIRFVLHFKRNYKCMNDLKMGFEQGILVHAFMHLCMTSKSYWKQTPAWYLTDAQCPQIVELADKVSLRLQITGASSLIYFVWLAKNTKIINIIVAAINRVLIGTIWMSAAFDWNILLLLYTAKITIK